MNLSVQPSINFKARLLSKANVLKYDSDNDCYKDNTLSFVEVSPKDISDRRAVKEAVGEWRQDLYGDSMAKSMEYFSFSSEKDMSDKFFVITEQKDNFVKLEPEKIEALTHVFESNKRVKVVHLQVNPDLIYPLGNPEYKHVGKGMIDCLKDKYNDRSIHLISSPTATKFYEKQGFERTNDPENRLVWNKEAEADCKYKEEYW